jgi:uncharacterized protein YkwD
MKRLLAVLLFACIRERSAPATTTVTTTTGSDGTGPAGPRAGITVDTSQREAVRLFFMQHYAPSDGVPSDWNGNVDLKFAGATSAAFKNAVIERVNFLRAMAGVPADITLNEPASNKAQSAALMMSAADQLSHYPSTTWPAYTPEGAEAAGKSNLYLGVRGPQAMTGYVRDEGSNNAAVGHRRWLLHPQTRTMGTGDVEKSGKYRSANVLWVVEDATSNSPRPVTRDGFIAWPPRGYVPYQLVFARWSLSLPNARFESATVHMTRDGAPIALQSAPNVSDGFGENAIVWEPSGVAGTDSVMTKPPTDTTFGITIRNVNVDGVMREISYTVVAFDTGAIVATPPLGTPPAEWPTNIQTPWGSIPTITPTQQLPTTFPIPWPLPK